MGLVSRRSEDDEPVEVRILGFGGLDVGRQEDLVIDLADWSEQSLGALRERLVLLAVPHAWEETALVVSPDDEAWVERILEQVEDEQALTVDPEEDQVGYDLAEWDEQNRDLLFAALHEQQIAYAFHDDELVVNEIDEVRVDELVDAILEPDAPRTGGEARTEVMGEIFVAADRLVHDADDAAATLSLIDCAEVTSSYAPPYGMDKVWWEGIGERTNELVDRLAAAPRDHDAIVDLATHLRDALRPYV